MVKIPGHILIKLQEAAEIPSIILKLCYEQILEPNDLRLIEISVRLGTMAHHLRSALNYLMWDFTEKRLKKDIPKDEYEMIKWSHDYPIEEDKHGYLKSRSRVLRHIKHYPKIYDYIELSQPYHQRNSVFWTIKLLSNDSTHTIPIKVDQPDNPILEIENVVLKMIGNEAQVFVSGRDPIIKRIPCFIEDVNVYATKEGEWRILLIDSKVIGTNEKERFSVSGFMTQANQLINNTIVGFYNLL